MLSPRLWPFESPGVVSSALAEKTTRNGSRGLLVYQIELFQRVSPSIAPPKYWRTVGEKPNDSPKGLNDVIASQSGDGVLPRTVVPNEPDRPALASRAQKPSVMSRPAAPTSTRR